MKKIIYRLKDSEKESMYKKLFNDFENVFQWRCEKQFEDEEPYVFVTNLYLDAPEVYSFYIMKKDIKVIQQDIWEPNKWNEWPAVKIPAEEKVLVKVETEDDPVKYFYLIGEIDTANCIHLLVPVKVQSDTPTKLNFTYSLLDSRYPPNNKIFVKSLT